MISNPNLILYSCIAKGPTILTQFLSSSLGESESGISDIAQKCIERTPPNHSFFSHTVRNKTYAFLIQYPFAYFVICNEDLTKIEYFWFLSRVKTLFEDLILSNLVDEKFSALCFQTQFHPVFKEILAVDVELIDSASTDVSKISRNHSMDSTVEKRSVVRPLLSKPAKVFMKKKKRAMMGCVGDSNGGALDYNKTDINGDVILSRAFSVSTMQKNGGYCGGDSRHKANQMWRKHVWVVLVLDVVVCAVLFGIWLWVCRGFKCIDG